MRKGECKVNKTECKKYLARAYKRAILHNKSITTQNIETEMINVINNQAKEYIAYCKIAIYNWQNSANSSIKLKDLYDEIEILSDLYNNTSAIKRAKELW